MIQDAKLVDLEAQRTPDHFRCSHWVAMASTVRTWPNCRRVACSPHLRLTQPILCRQIRDCKQSHGCFLFAHSLSICDSGHDSHMTAEHGGKSFVPRQVGRSSMSMRGKIIRPNHDLAPSMPSRTCQVESFSGGQRCSALELTLLHVRRSMAGTPRLVTSNLP